LLETRNPFNRASPFEIHFFSLRATLQPAAERILRARALDMVTNRAFEQAGATRAFITTWRDLT